MAKNFKNNAGASGPLGRLAAEKKKGVIALCLVVLMGIMWIRVLTNKGPAGAGAATTVDSSPAEEPLAEQLKITYIELPDVPGRNDVIERDFFDPKDWQGFNLGKLTGRQTGQPDANSVDADKEVARRIEQLVMLEAIGIGMGQRPQAYLNGKLLSEGDELTVTDGTQTYQCQVVKIEKNYVVLKCREAEITLKLVRTPEQDS